MESIEALEDIYSVEQDWDSMVRLLDLRAEKGGEDITGAGVDQGRDPSQREAG